MSNTKNAERLEKLQGIMSVHSLPDIAAAANVPLLEAELYATGRKVMPDKVWEKLNSAIIAADYERTMAARLHELMQADEAMITAEVPEDVAEQLHAWAEAAKSTIDEVVRKLLADLPRFKR